MQISRTSIVLFFLWIVLLTASSLLPPDIAPSWLPSGGKWDKAAHFLAYFLTALFFQLTFRKRVRNADLFAILFASAYGGLLEVAQLAVPGRDPSFGDLAANITGVLFFFVLYRILWGG